MEGVWRVLERLERLESFGAFAGWQTAALKANRKPLLWPWPRRVWKVLEGLGGLEGFGGCLEGLEGFGAFGAFGEFWSVCGLANGSFESQ